MIRWIKPPNNSDVANFVECYWCLDKQENSSSNEYPKLNPDPAAHLIISHPAQKHHYKFEHETLTGTGSHWLYPHQHTYQMNHEGPLALIGVKFHIGALYSIPSHQNSPLINQTDAFKFDNFSVSNSLMETEFLSNLGENADNHCHFLDELLFPWLSEGTLDKHAKLVRRIIPLLSSTDISLLSKILNSSQRTLERSFLRVTGLTMKQCQSMKRLETLLECLYQREEQDIEWADIAFQFGFSDQPHLIRYLKNTIGSTPSQYAKQRDLTIDIYGGIESL